MSYTLRLEGLGYLSDPLPADVRPTQRGVRFVSGPLALPAPMTVFRLSLCDDDRTVLYEEDCPSKVVNPGDTVEIRWDWR